VAAQPAGHRLFNTRLSPPLTTLQATNKASNSLAAQPEWLAPLNRQYDTKKHAGTASNAGQTWPNNSALC